MRIAFGLEKPEFHKIRTISFGWLLRNGVSIAEAGRSLFRRIDMKIGANVSQHDVAILPRGWVILGLAALAWLPVVFAWTAFSAVSTALL